MVHSSVFCFCSDPHAAPQDTSPTLVKVPLEAPMRGRRQILLAIWLQSTPLLKRHDCNWHLIIRGLMQGNYPRTTNR